MAYRGAKPSAEDDLAHLQELHSQFRALVTRCHQYAEMAASPVCAQLFHDVGYGCEAHVRSLEKGAEHSRHLPRTAQFDEWVQEHLHIQRTLEPGSEKGLSSGTF